MKLLYSFQKKKEEDSLQLIVIKKLQLIFAKCDSVFLKIFSPFSLNI